MPRLTENVKLLQKIALLANATDKAETKVLLLKRSQQAQSRPGCWDLPGGNTEWPSPEDAGFGQLRQDVARETEEETGIALEPKKLSVAQLVYIDTFFDDAAEVFSILTGWFDRLESQPEITLSHEHTEYAWVAASQLDEYEFGATGGFVKDIVMAAFKKNSTLK